MIDVRSSNDYYMDELEEAVDRLIEYSEKLAQENIELRQEVQILTEALRDLQWKMDGLNK